MTQKLRASRCFYFNKAIIPSASIYGMNSHNFKFYFRVNVYFYFKSEICSLMIVYLVFNLQTNKVISRLMSFTII